MFNICKKKINMKSESISQTGRTAALLLPCSYASLSKESFVRQSGLRIRDRQTGIFIQQKLVNSTASFKIIQGMFAATTTTTEDILGFKKTSDFDIRPSTRETSVRPFSLKTANLRKIYVATVFIFTCGNIWIWKLVASSIVKILQTWHIQ